MNCCHGQVGDVWLGRKGTHTMQYINFWDAAPGLQCPCNGKFASSCEEGEVLFNKINWRQDGLNESKSTIHQTNFSWHQLSLKLGQKNGKEPPLQDILELTVLPLIVDDGIIVGEGEKWTQDSFCDFQVHSDCPKFVFRMLSLRDLLVMVMLCQLWLEVRLQLSSEVWVRPLGS